MSWGYPFFINSHFEKATLPKRYDNTMLIHVLKHRDNPVRVLKRDRLPQTYIPPKEHLAGYFKLGQQHTGLCSGIFSTRERGGNK